MPTPQSLHYDKALTNLAVKMGIGSFAAPRLAPIVPVTKISDKYVKFGDDDINAGDVQPRAARARSGEGRWTKSDDSYSAQEYPFKIPVAQDEIENSDPPLDPQGRAAESAKNRVMLAYELRVKAKFIDTANYSTVTAAAAAWATATAVQLFGDIDTAVEAVEVKSGHGATHIAIPIAKARDLMRNPAMLDQIRYTDPRILVDGFMPPVFRGLQVILLGGRNNAANEGQAATPARAWNITSAGVFHIEENPGTSGMTWMSTFRWSKFGQNGEGVRKWWVDDGRYWYHEYAHYQDEKVVATQAGALITGI